MIGYWHYHVVAVVRLSVRLSVTLCIAAFTVDEQAKSCTSVFLAGKFLFVPLDMHFHYSRLCIVSPQIAPKK